MSLEIRKSSHWWYGVFTVDGRKTVINLGVPITGKRPPKRTMLGDDEFERSRGRAQEAYRVLRRKMAGQTGPGPGTRSEGSRRGAAATGRLTGRDAFPGPGLYRQPGRHAQGREDARDLHRLHGRAGDQRGDGVNRREPGVSVGPPERDCRGDRIRNFGTPAVAGGGRIRLRNETPFLAERGVPSGGQIEATECLMPRRRQVHELELGREDRL
jgi:hypothetical protein